MAFKSTRDTKQNAIKKSTERRDYVEWHFMRLIGAYGNLDTLCIVFLLFLIRRVLYIIYHMNMNIQQIGY